MTARETVTNALEVVGGLLIAAGASVEVARWSLAGALATAGVLLIGQSALVAFMAPKPGPRGEESA